MRQPVFDAHIHCTHPVPVRESVQLFQRIFDLCTVSHMGFASIPHSGERFRPLQNICCLYYKAAFSPNAYAFAGLEHDFQLTEEESAQDFLRQVKAYCAVGFDGIKMLEGQTPVYKYLGVRLDSTVYEPMYTYLEEQEIPILMHLANPKEFWDINRVPAYALKVGRFCDETFPKFEEFYAQMFTIMERHPNLKLTLAHWGFFSEDRDLAERFFSYPNTMLDITPGGEQIHHMEEYGIEKWVAFIKKYSHRIKYGSDAYNFKCGNEEAWRADALYRPTLLRNFLEGKPTNTYEYDGFLYHGIALEKEYLDRIYRENALQEYGVPKPIDVAYCQATVQRLMQTVAPDSLDAYDLFCMQHDFEKFQNN